MKFIKHLRYLLVGILILGFLPVRAQIKINEIVSSNITQLSDEDGEFPDWIEILNTSDQTISLGQYTLTDNIDDTTKWTFPALQIAPGEYQVVFASGKDKTSITNTWNSIIDQGTTMNYLVPGSDIGDTWKNTGFDASSWSSGASGFGFGDSDDATETGTVMSVYARKEFNIANISDVTQLIFHMDYDDGFAAYINGVEIARDRLGTPGTTVAFDAAADAYDHEAKIYQGLAADEFKVYGWEDILVQGTNVFAVEVHNHSTTSSDLSCIPILTLGLKSSRTNSISEHITVPESYLHTNFKIKAEGEALYLFNNKVFVDSVGATNVPSDVSYGRQPDGGDDWYYFETPTPFLSNGNNGITSGLTDTVVFSVSGGNLRTSSMSVLLSTKNNTEGSIYYTTDGSVPTSSSTLYTGAITFTSDIVIRARVINDGQLPGPVGTETYVLTLDHSFPIVSLSTNPENLFDYYTGIYELGPNASSSNPYYGANFWQDWEKPVHFEYYDKNGIKQIDQGAGVKIYGAWSRAHPQKSLALFARKEYGDGSFSYKFFDSKDNDKFEAIVLRNAGNDFYYAHFRDGMMTTAMSEIGVEYQGIQPTAVYINGEYWGILNMREKINEHFVSDNTHIDANEVRILESTYETNGVIENGEGTKYVEMLNFVQTNSLQTDDNYEYVCSVIDIENFIDYYLIQTYVDNTDWPGNNNKFWNTTNDASKYRWVLFDTDFGFNLYGNQNYTNNTIAYASSETLTGLHNEEWATLLFRSLMENTEFKKKFVQRGCDYLNTHWQPDSINPIIDDFTALYTTEMVAHCDRWDLDYTNWSNQPARMKTFANNRPTYYRSFLGSEMGFSGSRTVTLNVSPANSGTIKMNTLHPDDYPSTGTYFNQVPMELTAIPKPGYRFVRWSGSSISTNKNISYDISQNMSHTAVFEAIAGEENKVAINEIFYKSSDNIKPGDWIELYNYGETTIDLKDWVFRDSNKDSAYVIPSSYLLGPDEYVVICKDIKKFKTTYPWVKNVMGDFIFGLSSSGDALRLFNSDNSIVDAVDYYPSGSWPAEANGLGASCSLTDQYTANENGNNWFASFSGGTPGEENAEQIPNSITPIGESFNTNLQCYPNPVENTLNITFNVENSDNYRIDLIAINGATVKTIADDYFFSGEHRITFNKGEVHQNLKGIYMIRLMSTQGIKTTKVLFK